MTALSWRIAVHDGITYVHWSNGARRPASELETEMWREREAMLAVVADAVATLEGFLTSHGKGKPAPAPAPGAATAAAPAPTQQSQQTLKATLAAKHGDKLNGREFGKRIIPPGAGPSTAGPIGKLP